MKRPYTIITAFRQEIRHWNLTPAQRAFLTAFVFCLKLRMEGSSLEETFK